MICLAEGAGSSSGRKAFWRPVVNGQVTIDNGKPTGATPGRLIRTRTA